MFWTDIITTTTVDNILQQRDLENFFIHFTQCELRKFHFNNSLVVSVQFNSREYIPA